MSKQMIGRLFFGSLAAFVGSLTLTGAAVMVAVNRDVFIMNGPDVVGVRSGSGAWARSPRREAGADKTWFIVLLVLGLFSIGFLATLIYLVAGPPEEPEPAAPTAVEEIHARPTPVAH